MSTILLAGNFRGFPNLFQGLGGVKLLHCHSIDSLRSEWGKAGVLGVCLAVKELTPSLFEMMEEGRARVPTLRWILLVQRVNHDLVPFNGGLQLFLQGQPMSDWEPRIRRFLREESLHHRREERRACKGGVRIKDSDFTRGPVRGRKSYGQIGNLSPLGASFCFDETFPYPQGEFLEIAFRDARGSARVFHGQVRWVRRRPDGTTEVGFQFLAAAS